MKETYYGRGAKAYCVKAGDVTKKGKGVSKSVVQREINLADYIHIVENHGSIFRKMYIFKSTLHSIYTELKNKVVICSSEDKRCMDLKHDQDLGALRFCSTKKKFKFWTLTEEAHKLIIMDEKGWDFNLDLFDRNLNLELLTEEDGNLITMDDEGKGF